MTQLTIQLEPQDAERLNELARQCGKSPEELVEENLRHWLADKHTEFLAAANLVLHKNAELYRRISFQDLLKYKNDSDAAAKKAVDELQRLSEELDLP